MKLMDKLKLNKKILLFILIIGITGLIAGSTLVNILNYDDKKMIVEYIYNFIENVKNNSLDCVQAFKNNYITNVLYLVFIFIFGISTIGFPIIIIIFFSKLFITGFSIGSIIYTYKLKGIALGIVYVFPGTVISIFSLLLLSIWGINISFKLIHALSNKKVIDFKQIVRKYFLIFLFCLTLCLIGTISDTFLMPYLIKLVISFID